MKRFFIFLILGISPVLGFAEQFDVSPGDKGNSFSLTVKNEYPFLLKNVYAEIYTAPQWLKFYDSKIQIGDLSTGDKQTIRYEYDILTVQPGKTDSIEVIYCDATGDVFAYGVVTLHTVVADQQTQSLTAYPNPANPGTTIHYILNEPSLVKLEIYNVFGQRVRTLIHENKPAGTIAIAWNGTDNQNLAVSSGIYFIRLSLNNNLGGGQRQFSTKVLIQR
jgi:hypothetical protein